MLSEFAKEKVFWTEKMNLQLVKFIQRRPNIWNPKHSKYTSIESRDQTYGEFAAKYGNEFTRQAVKDRWTNIRSTFANYLRKYKASQALGEEFQVNWCLWESCQFLIKVHRKNRSRLQSFRKNGKERQATPTFSNSEEEEDYTNSNSDNHCRKIADNLVTILKKSQNNIFCTESSPYDKIGMDVSNRLSLMDSHQAGQVSLKIIEILNLYDQNNPNNSMSVKQENN